MGTRVRLIKNSVLMLLPLLLVLSFCAAEGLPNGDCFSPGIREMGFYLSSGAPTETCFSLSISNALFIPDIKVLSAIFSELTLKMNTEETENETQTVLSMLWKEEPVASAVIHSVGEKTMLLLDGKWYKLPVTADVYSVPDSFQPITEAFLTDRFLRLPLDDMEKALQEWRENESFFGYSLVRKMETVFEKKNSNNYLKVSGNLKKGEELWSISAVFQSGSGDTPNAEAEIHAFMDEDNHYSLKISEQQKRTGKGETGGALNVTLRASLEGKSKGHPIDGSLSISLKNAWTKKNGILNEKINNTGKLTIHNKTPGINYRNLGHNIISIKETILSRKTDGEAPEGWTDEAKITIETDGGTLFSGTLAMSIKPGETRHTFFTGEEAVDSIDTQQLLQIIDAEAQRIAARIYARMDEKTKKQVQKGL